MAEVMPRDLRNRSPYVGSGPDGCRRSARIDREELMTFDHAAEPERAQAIQASIEAWETQAVDLESGRAAIDAERRQREEVRAAHKDAMRRPGPLRRCSSCHASILWARTLKAGKPMPLNARPDSSYGNVLLVGTFGDGAQIAVSLGTLDSPARLRAAGADVALYVPHHATCPNASKHRRRSS